MHEIIWDRAVTLLPRINQFWFKYVCMEEMLGNIPNTRRVFKRWMEWEPEERNRLAKPGFQILKWNFGIRRLIRHDRFMKNSFWFIQKQRIGFVTLGLKKVRVSLIM